MNHANNVSCSSILSYIGCVGTPSREMAQCVSKGVVLHCVLLLQHRVDILNPLVVSCIILINSHKHEQGKSLDGRRVFVSYCQSYLGGVYY